MLLVTVASFAVTWSSFWRHNDYEFLILMINKRRLRVIAANISAGKPVHYGYKYAITWAYGTRLQSRALTSSFSLCWGLTSAYFIHFNKGSGIGVVRLA